MPNYKLTYFNGRGRAEVTRLIFAVAGVQYQDERITDWPNGKDEAPLGQLPYLTVDDVKIPQSFSLARYVAKIFKLAGEDDLEQAKVDGVVDTIYDLLFAYYTKVYSAKEEEKKTALEKFLAQDAIVHLDRIEKIIGMYGSNGFSVGTSLKWSDLHLFDSTSIIKSLSETILDKYPKILAVRKTVESNERVAHWLKTRPESRF